jgi:hypothetical protein
MNLLGNVNSLGKKTYSEMGSVNQHLPGNSPRDRYSPAGWRFYFLPFESKNDVFLKGNNFYFISLQNYMKILLIK